MRNIVLVGDVRERLKEIPDACVQTCVTSPPYWGLRDYGVDGQIGLEASPDAYVERLVLVFREVRRVLHDSGTLWLNIGDTYVSNGGHTKQGESSQRKGRSNVDAQNHDTGRHGFGVPVKNLIGIPWRLAFGLQADGWLLRSEIIWEKPNVMPESVTDRPTRSHEQIFLLSKKERYFYDQEAIREPATQGHAVTGGEGSCRDDLVGRNKRTVWKINPKPYKKAHFATFPEELPETCIKAGSRPGDLVLDPFSGSGTTLAVAKYLRRDYIGIELNPEYAKLIEERIRPAEELESQRTAIDHIATWDDEPSV